MRVCFQAFGHPSVLSTHPTTLEITRERSLSTRGDCVVAVGSSKGAVDLPHDLKVALARSDVNAKLVLRVGSLRFIVRGTGDPRLTLSHPTDMVVRRSGFISDRTLMIHADKSASDLPREMVHLLQDPKITVSIEISTTDGETPG